MNEPFVPGTKEFEERFFRDGDVVTLQVDVLKEMYDELSVEARRQGVELPEVARAVLARGLARARADDYLSAADGEKARIARQLFDLESNLAVMRYNTFSLMRDNQTLEMQNAALRNANEGLKAAVDRLHGQEEELLEQIRTLQTESGAAPMEPSDHHATERASGPRSGILERLRRRLSTAGRGRR